MLTVYNTLSRKLESFKPLKDNLVGFYSCGPTVYDFAHIGHARTYVFADVLQRVLEFDGYKVKRVMNITDVGHLVSDSDTGEDKMEKGAKREKKTVWEIANFYTADFMKMMEDLNIKKPEIICLATDHIKEMISLVRTLEEKGYTYTIADGVYFDTAKLPDYGKLTGKTFSDLIKTLKAGARIEPVKGKKNITDFALWKRSSEGVTRQMEWDSPWGKGFPGWHIECSAMSMHYLGDTLDIHSGGVDHIPIHHTNEIAQSEACTGKPFVRFFIHAEYLQVEGDKMSKSKGNFYRVKDLVKKGFNPLSLRYLFLTASYRQQLNFTWKSLKGAERAYQELTNKISEIRSAVRKGERVSLSAEKLKKVDDYRDRFTDKINDDLNTAAGLAVLWEVVKSNVPAGDKFDLVVLFDEVLGLRLREIMPQKQQAVPVAIKKLIKKRENLRKNNKFTRADEVRKKIERAGFIIEDTPKGPKVLSKK